LKKIDLNAYLKSIQDINNNSDEEDPNFIEQIEKYPRQFQSIVNFNRKGKYKLTNFPKISKDQGIRDKLM